VVSVSLPSTAKRRVDFCRTGRLESTDFLDAIVCSSEVEGHIGEIKMSSLAHAGSRLYADFHPECVEKYYDDRRLGCGTRSNASSAPAANFGYAPLGAQSSGERIRSSAGHVTSQAFDGPRTRAGAGRTPLFREPSQF